MSGIDKIIEQINADSKSEAENILAQANKNAEEILAIAKEETEKSTAQLKSECELKCKNIADRAESAANLIKKQALLKAKQQLIKETIDLAHNKLLSLSDEEYFNLIIKMVEKYSNGQKAEIYFNQKDLDRMPVLYSVKLAKACKGGLKLSNKHVNIDGGFILSYGGIEENCSFKALFEGGSELLQDKVNSLLFS